MFRTAGVLPAQEQDNDDHDKDHEEDATTYIHNRPNAQPTTRSNGSALIDNDDAVGRPDGVVTFLQTEIGRLDAHVGVRRPSVVGLVTEGATNVEVGRRLLMRPSTVKSHSTHVYARLGVLNRAELLGASDLGRCWQRKRRAGMLCFDMGNGLDSGGGADRGVVTRLATGTVAAVLDRLLETLRSRGVKVFAVIDHSGEAAQVGQDLRNTKLVIFGNPAMGTPLMKAAPLVALDLPLKLLVWERDDQRTCVSYNAPSYVAERYGISDEEQLGVLSIVDALADVLVEPDA